MSQRFIVLGSGTGEKLILANAGADGIDANLFFTLFGLDAVHKGTPAGGFNDLTAGREIIFT